MNNAIGRGRRFPKSEEAKEETRERTERLAEQLYNVMQNRLVEIDPAMESEREPWSKCEEDGKELFRAQATYVLSTDRENERLRKEIAVLKGRGPGVHPAP